MLQVSQVWTIGTANVDVPPQHPGLLTAEQMLEKQGNAVSTSERTNANSGHLGLRRLDQQLEVTRALSPFAPPDWGAAPR